LGDGNGHARFLGCGSEKDSTTPEASASMLAYQTRRRGVLDSSFYDRSGEDRSGPRAGQTDRGNGDGAHAGRALPALLHRHRGRVDGGGNHGPQRRGVFWRPAFQAQTPEPRRARLPRGHRVLVLRHQYQAVEQGRALRPHRPARDLPRRPPLGPQARPAGGMKKGELKTTGGIEYPAMLIEMAGSTSPRVKGPSWRSRGAGGCDGKRLRLGGVGA